MDLIPNIHPHQDEINIYIVSYNIVVTEMQTMYEVLFIMPAGCQRDSRLEASATILNYVCFSVPKFVGY